MTSKWLMDTVEISGGFLAGLSLQFPPGLTCIIGPRGSGKSTLAEALRLAIFGTDGLQRQRLDLVQANLGSAFVTLTTQSDDRGEHLIVRRGFKQQASVTASTSRPLPDIELERGTFLPLDAYTSNEIESIADESLGQRRRALLDDLIGDELHQIEMALAERRRALDGNADTIRSISKKIADYNEQIEEIGDAPGRLAELPPLPPGEASSELSAATKQQSQNEEESSNLQRAIDAANGFTRDLQSLLARHDATLGQPLVVAGSQNQSFMNPAAGVLKKAVLEVKRLCEQQVEVMDRAVRELGGIRKDILEEHKKQKAEFDNHQQENLVASQAAQRRMSAEKEVAALAKLVEQRNAAREELRAAHDSRGRLKADYLLEAHNISQLRSHEATRLQTEAGGRVRIRVLENADDLEYQQMLTTGLKGARVRNHEDILSELLRLRPDDLAQMIQANDLDAFESHASFGSERSAKILAAFKANLDPFNLELVSIDDHVRIELDVSGKGTSIFKDASELSRGQKCTALLPILLARRDSPLLIDQPEDNLDNHFIYETVVEAIRRIKSDRQMVFITHNANIPVLGEAEMIVVLNSDGTRGFVEKVGNLDECRGEIIDLLEGGEEAFELRRQCYARP